MMGFGIFGIILVVILLGAVVVLGAGIFRGFLPRTTGESNMSSSMKIGAKEILDQRYAKGEITEGEYQKMKKDIND